MAYIASLYKGGRVVDSLRSCFLSPSEENLIVARKDGVDIYRLVDEDDSSNLKLELSFEVFGGITTLQTYRPDSYKTDCLLLTTSTSTFFSVRYDAATKTVVDDKIGKSIGQPHTEAAEVHLALKDPEGRMLGLHLHKGMFIALPLRRDKPGLKAVSSEQRGKLDEPVFLRFSQFDVLDMIFLSGTKVPTLAMLCLDWKGRPGIYTFEVEGEEKKGAKKGMLGEKKLELDYKKLGRSVSCLIGVAEPLGGFITAGMRRVAYKNRNLTDSKLVYASLPNASELTGYGIIDCRRYLLGDRAGRLYGLFLETSNDTVTGIEVTELGITSVAHKLVPFSNDRLYVASQYGDSQLVQINTDRKSCQVLQDLRNLSPITDLLVPELGYAQKSSRNQYAPDQARIVTASGWYQDGALKSVRNGVSEEVLGEIESEGVRAVFPLDNYLVFSYVGETRAFEFSDEIVEKETYFGFDLSVDTLLAMKVPVGYLQVTSRNAAIFDTSSRKVAEWTPPTGQIITLATGRNGIILLAVNGLALVHLSLDLSEAKRREFLSEISCLHLPESEDDIALVGFWSGNITILELDTFEPLSGDPLSDGESIPRSILLSPLIDSAVPSVLVGMADGTLFTFSYNRMDSTLSSRSRISLSNDPVTLYDIPRTENLRGAFAACGQSTIIYGNHGHLVYSVAMDKDVKYVTQLNTGEDIDTIAIATHDKVSFVKIAPERCTHTATYPVGEVVRNMAHSRKRRVIAGVTIRMDVEGQDEEIACSIKVFDDVEFSILDEMKLLGDELSECVTVVQLQEGEGEDARTLEIFVAGTSFLAENDVESTRGRVIAFDLSPERKIRVLHEEDLGLGGIRSIQSINGKLLVGTSRDIAVYKFNSYPAPTLRKECGYRPHCEVVQLDVYNNMIAVADLLAGPFLLRYIEKPDPKSESKIEEVARTYGRRYFTMSLQLLDQETILASDSQGHLSLFRIKPTATADELAQLEIIAQIRLEDNANAIRRIDFPPPSAAEASEPAIYPVSPYAHIGLSNGTIYIFCLVRDQYLSSLLELQDGLDAETVGLGGLSFGKWRGDSETGKPLRFVDGDFIRGRIGLRRVERYESVKKILGDDGEVGVEAMEGLARFLGV